MTPLKKLVRNAGIFKAVIKGESYQIAANEYGVVVNTAKKAFNEIASAVLTEHCRESISALEGIVVCVSDTQNLLSELRTNPTKWCVALDTYLTRRNIQVTTIISNECSPASTAFTGHPRPIFPPYGKAVNKLILPKDNVVSALQQGFCDKFGIVGGDNLKIAFIVNGVEVDPSTVEVRTTL
jgi:hypothetical protein